MNDVIKHDLNVMSLYIAGFYAGGGTVQVGV